MADIYYCRNEDDMKRVAIHIFEDKVNNVSVDEGISDSYIYSCDYVSNKVTKDGYKIESCVDCCNEEFDCVLCEHLKDKNVHKHIELCDVDAEYPFIVCVADTYYPDESITICSVKEAKENTKYGCK